MNMLKVTCKELGVEIGEEWLGNDGKTYIIENGRILEYYEPENYSDTDYEGWVVSEYKVYADILQGKLKPVWKPKEGEEYYTPFINSFRENDRYSCTTWDGDYFDRWALENKIICETKEDAIEVTNKILAFLKE